MIKYVWLAATLMIVFCLVSSGSARSATSATYNHITSDKVEPTLQNAGSTQQSIWNDLSAVYKIYKQCASENLSVCLKVKLLKSLDSTIHKVKTVKIIEGVQFVKNTNENGQDAEARSTSSIANLSQKDIEALLPRGLETKEHVLNNMIFKMVTAFLKDHTLQLKFPDLRTMDFEADNSVEGRRRKKKGSGAYIMIPLLLGGTFIPIAYGALAMLAGKALIVSKLALVLASIIGIKKLLSGGGKDASHEVVVSSGGHSGWGRDMDLAYQGWKPTPDMEKHV
ncbi:uncharacterized protein LOC119676267 [Teleopsis dalmanni]|uniref:uncharacterized protein LOC119676267 n=1 Tax=Teleopsis dalmanni TaxID=139649 RepID=UPI0018CD6FC5|nr:uncharacterized protein LOC119676267 [Teleopsis dalmanni]